jgi:hypothetical protein
MRSTHHAAVSEPHSLGVRHIIMKTYIAILAIAVIAAAAIAQTTRSLSGPSTPAVEGMTINDLRDFINTVQPQFPRGERIIDLRIINPQKITIVTGRRRRDGKLFTYECLNGHWTLKETANWMS